MKGSRWSTLYFLYSNSILMNAVFSSGFSHCLDTLEAVSIFDIILNIVSDQTGKSYGDDICWRPPALGQLFTIYTQAFGLTRTICPHMFALPVTVNVFTCLHVEAPDFASHACGWNIKETGQHVNTRSCDQWCHFKRTMLKCLFNNGILCVGKCEYNHRFTVVKRNTVKTHQLKPSYIFNWAWDETFQVCYQIRVLMSFAHYRKITQETIPSLGYVLV